MTERTELVPCNYGEEKPAFDNNAYAFSSTYHSGPGTLQLYTHHPSPPTTPGGQLGCHMTPIKSYALTSDRETFVAGATAFRNLRDKAKENRDRFIGTANAAREVMVQRDKGPNPDEFLDCEENAASREFPDEPQHPPRGSADYATSQDVNEAPEIPQYLEDDDQDVNRSSIPYNAEQQAESSTNSFISSAASGSTEAYRDRSERQRDSHSPSSSLQNASKHHAAQPGHWSGSGEKHHRSKGHIPSSGKEKANVSSFNAWDWDAQELEYGQE